jgi:hypothetical protein
MTRWHGSILMSMLAHRERARSRGTTAAILARSRLAYAKAGLFFCLELVVVPLAADWRSDVAAAR